MLCDRNPIFHGDIPMSKKVKHLCIIKHPGTLLTFQKINRQPFSADKPFQHLSHISSLDTQSSQRLLAPQVHHRRMYGVFLEFLFPVLLRNIFAWKLQELKNTCNSSGHQKRFLSPNELNGFCAFSFIFFIPSSFSYQA